MIVVAMMMITFIFSVFTPRVFASRSPIESTFSFHLIIRRAAILIIIGIHASAISSSPTLPKLPISQKVIAGSFSSSSATNLIKDSIAWKNADTTVPDRISIRTGVVLYMCARKYVIPTATRPITKDVIWIPIVGSSNTRPIAAPKLAPADTPRIYGSTSGFWNIPWKDAPDIESPAPIRVAIIARGSRILITTVAAEVVHVCVIGRPKISAPMILITSSGITIYLPRNKLVINRATSRTAISTHFHGDGRSSSALKSISPLESRGAS